jgi:glycosyltransferase involved in cell wall biosynthesis
MFFNKISFIIPTYNRSSLIEKSLKSIAQQQTDCEIEIIIIDDGTDNTADVVNDFIKENKFISLGYFKNTTRIGLPKSRNLGLLKCKGDLIIIFDSDNIMKKDGLNGIIKTFKKEKDIDLAFFKSEFKSGVSRYKDFFLNKVITYDDYIANLPLGEYLPVLTRKLLNKNYKFEEKVWGFEGLLWARILKSGHNLFISNSVVQLYDDVMEERLSTVSRQQALNRVIGMQLYLREFSLDIQRLNWSFYKRLIQNYYVYYKVSGTIDHEISTDVKNKLNYMPNFYAFLLMRLPGGMVSIFFPMLIKIRKLIS